MSHLGERLTALVDGELGHEERDRALAHLAACERCRVEAEALRRLKRRLRTLRDATPDDALVTRLYAMGESGGPLPPPARPLPGMPRSPHTGRPWLGTRPQRATRPGDNRPRRGATVRQRLPRPRYLIAGAATLAVFGIGTASFVAGADPASLPQVAPAVERFAVEHALTSGDVPLTDPSPVETTSRHGTGP